MKINNLSFPYPVLGVGDDVMPTPHLLPKPVIKNRTSYIFEADLDMKNQDIAKYIKTGYAKYVCEVECPRTMLRKCWFSNQPNFCIEIPRTHLAERVSFQFSIIVMRPITGYHNRQFHEDYREYTFDLEPGDLLAFIGQFTYDVEIRYDKLRAIGSFMEITEGKNEQRPRYILGGDKIEIRLPSAMYNTYKESIRGNQKFANVIHSSIVFNALVTALLFFEQNSHTLWARTLKYRIDNEATLSKFKNFTENEDSEEIIELAQNLLSNPYQRLFDTLVQFSTIEEE